MKNFSYRNRIAINYLLATGTLLLLVFFLIFFVVQLAVYAHLDRTLRNVAQKHANEVHVENNKITFINKSEWEEREHREVEVNPVFIEVHGLDGKIMDKSPNLKIDELGFNPHIPTNKSFNTHLENQQIRQIKIEIIRNSTKYGYISAAIPIDGYLLVLSTLRNILFFTFIFSLLVLFLSARYLAGKSIQPVKTIINKARLINYNNLNDRIPVPVNNDELYELTVEINQLLERIHESIEREKQFTADAAHQLKTPLAVLKGSFGVLIRKPRTNEDLVKKITESMTEIERLSDIVDNLLLLARMNTNAMELRMTEISLIEAIDKVIQRLSRKIEHKEIRLVFEPQSDFTVVNDPFIIDLILENLLSNAIKYSHKGGQIEIACRHKNELVVLQLHDKGIGIASEEINKIFLPFYRGSSEVISHEKGSGIGLSIVTKACKIADINLTIQSRLYEGTHIQLEFQK